MAVQPRGQLSGAQRRAPGRGQLDGQRDAVQPGAHLRDRGRVARRQLEGGAGRSSPGREQQAGLGRGDRRGRAVGRQSQRRHREDQLTGNIQAFPAGGQEPHPPAASEQLGHQARCPLQDVLAVVQHHQQLTAGQRAHQPGGRGGRIPLGNAQGLRDAGRDQGRIGERGQLDQPGAVAKAGLGERRHPQRQPGLAAPSRTGQRDHPAAAEPVTHGSYLRAAAHQRAHLGRQPRLPLRKTCRLRTPFKPSWLGTTLRMTRLTASYDLAGRDIPPSADAARNGNRESFLTGTPPIREGPDEPHPRSSRQCSL